MKATSRFEQKVTIVSDLGLHLRAAGALVQVASRYRADIRLIRGSTTANAKSIMSVLSLAAGRGVELLIETEGEDAKEALESLVSLIARGFVQS